MRLDFLRPLYGGTGGCASLYLDASHTTEDAAELVALRWRAAREQLAGEGTDPATLGALEELVTAQQQSMPGLAAFARRGEVTFAAELPRPPRREISRHARLPHVMPLLAQLPPLVPQLHVRADRSGGEIVAVGPRSDSTGERVSGSGWPVHKASVGGWSQARYQRSAEEAWAENAKQLAEAVTSAATQTGAGLIVVAGDTRARSLLLEHLGTPLRESVVVVDREVGASSGLVEEVAEQAAQARADGEAAAAWNSSRARSALAGAAAATGAALHFIPDGEQPPRSGVGALLRYPAGD